MDRLKSDHTIFPQPCPGLVEIVEQGRLDDHDLVMRTLHDYFDRYDLSTIDSVVLGCTHFVFYRDYFRELLPDSAAIIDGNQGTVRHLSVVLESLGKLAPDQAVGGIELANSDTSERIAELAEALLHR
jgi:glutamate racemase